jgi:hypothetical protein
VKRIDVLPGEVLLDIFDFYMNMKPPYRQKEVDAWQTLVHVSRRWRCTVFRSPRRLNLRLYCTPKTPAKDALDVWPALPLIVVGDLDISSGTNNIIAALGQGNRVREVNLRLGGWQLKEILKPMEVSFPELTDLLLWSHYETVSVIPIPDSFLDGSAPSLRSFSLRGISFPGLPKLLSSATHLVRVDLKLGNISNLNSWCISPEAMAASLSVLSSLELLVLGFQPPKSSPNWESRSLPPPKRSILPALRYFKFKGVAEYLEHIVTFIDAPQLKTLDIIFFNQIDFDCPRLTRFIDCAPKLRECDEAHVQFNNDTASVKLRYRTSHYGFNDLQINFPCREPDRQLSSIQRVCNSYLHPLSMVEDLYIDYRYSKLEDWEDDAIESTLWLQLLLPFTGVKNLHISQKHGPGIAAALQELVGGRTAEVLPSLQNMSVWIPSPLGRFRENIAQFLTARRLSGQPVTASVRNEFIWNWFEEEEEEER